MSYARSPLVEKSTWVQVSWAMAASLLTLVMNQHVPLR